MPSNLTLHDVKSNICSDYILSVIESHKATQLLYIALKLQYAASMRLEAALQALYVLVIIKVQ